MRRLLLALCFLLPLVAAAPADAGWGHHCGLGYRGWGGCGWGGVAWGRWCGPIGISVGYPAFGCSPCWNYGCYSPVWYNPGFCGPTYGYGWGGPVGFRTFSYGAVGVPVPLAASVVRPLGAAPAGLTLADTLRLQHLAQRDAGDDRLRELDRGGLKVIERPAVRWSNAEMRRKAERYLADGDALFQAQNFHGALQKYKLAAAAAPDLAEPHWRQGHAAIATSHLELATAEFKRALALSGDLTRSGFQLDDLYGRAALAKAAHQERLAAWALERSDASDPFFLIGVTLAYDGQAERAAKFFVRAAELAGVASGHIAAFLEGDPAPPAAAAPLAPPAAEAPTVPVSVPTEI